MLHKRQRWGRSDDSVLIAIRLPKQQKLMKIRYRNIYNMHNDRSLSSLARVHDRTHSLT